MTAIGNLTLSYNSLSGWLLSFSTLQTAMHLDPFMAAYMLEGASLMHFSRMQRLSSCGPEALQPIPPHHKHAVTSLLFLALFQAARVSRAEGVHASCRDAASQLVKHDDTRRSRPRHSVAQSAHRLANVLCTSEFSCSHSICSSGSRHDVFSN